MEKRISKIILFLFINLLSINFYAQVPSQIEQIRIPLWAELDAYPGLEKSEDEKSEFTSIFEYPAKQIKKTAPYLISGMVYGWDFVYVPYDKARGVQEYFEVTEKQSFENYKHLINYEFSDIQESQLNCWCEYKRDAFQLKNYEMWSTLDHPVIKGKGYGSVFEGFDGFTAAAEDALKNAVREYYRKILKNKPKEISGAVLIRDVPLAGVTSGKYVLNLDFFLECGRIIEYTNY